MGAGDTHRPDSEGHGGLQAHINLAMKAPRWAALRARTRIDERRRTTFPEDLAEGLPYLALRLPYWQNVTLVQASLENNHAQTMP